MKKLAWFSLLAGFVLVGCHKKESATPAPAAPAETPTTEAVPAPASAPPQAQSAPTAIPAQPEKPLPPPPTFITANADNNVRQGVVGQVDGTLTAALRSYVNKKGHMPGSFLELVARGMDGTPRPPEGRHWVIDASDTTVKSVPNK